MPQSLRLIALSLLLLAAVPESRAGTLYSTDFEGFSAGDNRWAGTEGWLSNSPTGGVQGILQDPVQDLPLGKAAFLGYSLPATAFTSVYRSYNHDPVASGQPHIFVESLLGVQDSTNGRRDRFHLSFFNVAGDFLAAITFNNPTGKILTDDGGVVRDTGISFVRGDPVLGFAALQILRLNIDLQSNRWSASLDGIPLFNQTFTVTGKTLTLGTIAVEWEIPSGSPAMAGNNWLLVADWLVASIPPGSFSISSFSRDNTGTTTLSWPGHPGFDYQVLYSSGLSGWSADLPGSFISANPAENVISFDDPQAAGQARRFYRVVRTPSP